MPVPIGRSISDARAVAIPSAPDPLGFGLAILADDLTGACDSAAPFASVGGPVPVVLRPHLPAVGAPRIWAADLNVRDAPSNLAREVTRRAAKSVHEACRILLKVDSAGRGPLEALLDGALDGSGARAIVLAPAFPRQGATVVGGRIVINGSATRQGPDLAFLGPRDGPRHPTSVIQSRTVRRGPSALAREIRTAINTGAVRVVVDAETDACLEAVAAAWMRLDDVVIAGSGGVACALAQLCADNGSIRRPVQALAPRDADRCDGPILVVCGSPSPVTSAQVADLAARWSDGLVRVGLGDTAFAPAFVSPRVIVFDTSAGRSVVRDGGDLARAVARAAATWVAEVPAVGGVALIGGATARAFFEETGADTLEVLGEVQTGIAYGTARGGSLSGLRFVTKAGRFGETNALVRAVEHLVKGSD